MEGRTKGLGWWRARGVGRGRLPALKGVPIEVPLAVPELSRERGWGWSRWGWLAWVVPALVLLLIVLPLVHYELPNYKSTLTEEYQPFKTLKFLTSRGQGFHKWGPVDNFLLMPGYLLTFGWWKVTGQFSHGSSEFPYGLSDPLRQISFLILQSRIILLSLGLAAVAFYTRALGGLAKSAAAAPLAVLLVVATNPVLDFGLVALKPDAPMILFSALALAVYVRMVTREITTRRAVLFGVLAAVAIAAKESAIPLLGLPLVYVALRPRVGAERSWRVAAALAVSFVVTYGLVAVVYAPATWWARMTFWFAGPGISTEVWGASNATWWSLAWDKLRALADNLGPAGTPVAVGAVGYVLLARRGQWVALCLPLAGFAAALVKIGYAPDYFALPVSLAVAPLATVGIDRLLAARVGVAWRYGVMGVAIAVNFYYAQIAWLLPYQSEEVLVERDLARLPEGSTFTLCEIFRPSQQTRFQALHYAEDLRTLPDLVADGATKLPAYVYESDERAAWLADFSRRPERAKMILEEAGFDYHTFPGLQAWGYREERVLTPRLPGWYPFTFMPIATYDSPVRVYLRVAAAGG